MSRISPFLCTALLVAMVACPADDAETPGDGSTSEANTSAASEGSTSEGSSGADSTGGPPDVSGEEFYLSVCAPCHGQSGEGTAIGYALQHPVRDYSTWVVRNGRPPGNPELPGSVMTAYSTDTLGEATLEEIWDYLDTFPQPTTGEALYLDYCRNCHGEDATGGITGVSLLTAEAMLEPLDKVREGDNVGLYDMRAEAMPAFSPTRLSDAEVQLIVDHLATL
jgi:mono/diheme cytochrome c family protein